MTINVPKHGHCCAKNGPLCSSLFPRVLKEEKEKKTLDQKNRENNSLKAAFLALGTQNELSQKWKMLLNPAVNS